MDTSSAEPTDHAAAVQEPAVLEPSAEIALPARIALVGVHGFGAHHLDNLRRLRESKLADLVAVADPNPPAPGTLPESVAVHSDLDALIAANHRPDVIIVATPIQTHAPLALSVLAASSHLYLEKPPVASMADFLRLQKAASEAGKSVQVGFQSLGSHALPAIEAMLREGHLDAQQGGKLQGSGDLPGIGELQGVTATGRWVRDRAYYKRSRWAGKRSLDGVDVVDGVATNPLAHAIATALRIAGARTADDLASVETDLYRANDIEADDTSVIRLRTRNGLPITCALTLCATESAEPYITLHGTEGTAVFHYTEDRLTARTPLGESTRTFGRDDLTENLLQHLSTGSPLLSPLDHSGAFMRVVEAIRTAEPPAVIPDSSVDWKGTGDSGRAVVRGIEDSLERATLAHATFSELALPWARPAAPGTAESLFTGPAGEPEDAPLAVLRNGAALAEGLSPRPYLHPVVTVGGTVVTDHLPADHSWHLGAGFALQDVNGSNFWGGRSYRRSAGAYVALKDHGRIDVTGVSRTPTGEASLDLRWMGADGSALLTERRSFTRTLLDDRTWRLSARTELAAAVDASLGSPGSHGAAGSGYGGFFWRLPAGANPRVFTSSAEGEPAVHGAVAPWLAWTAEFTGAIGTAGTATLVFAAPPESPDPWFVRCAEYPAVGSALAWDRPVELAAGESLSRTITVWISDGALTAAEVEHLVAGK